MHQLFEIPAPTWPGIAGDIAGLNCRDLTSDDPFHLEKKANPTWCVIFAVQYSRATYTIITVTFWLLYAIDWAKMIISATVKPFRHFTLNDTHNVTDNAPVI